MAKPAISALVICPSAVWSLVAAVAALPKFPKFLKLSNLPLWRSAIAEGWLRVVKGY